MLQVLLGAPRRAFLLRLPGEAPEHLCDVWRPRCLAEVTLELLVMTSPVRPVLRGLATVGRVVDAHESK